nr:MAG TPA: hypothetical protein [Bacteriophage sp.]
MIISKWGYSPLFFVFPHTPFLYTYYILFNYI